MDSNTKPSVASAGHQEFVVTEWKPYEKGTLKGFASIILPSGLKINSISYHERDASRWLTMPSRKYTAPDGATIYSPMVEFESTEVRDSFRDVVMLALDEYFQQIDTEICPEVFGD